MKRYLQNLLLCSFVILLSGCGTLFFAEESEEKTEPLSIADWPTPKPTPLVPTTTPFPRVTLPPAASVQQSAVTRTATATPIVLDESDTSPAISRDSASGNSSGNVLGSLAQLRGLGSVPAIPPGLVPVAVGMTVADGTGIRQGPDVSYGTLEPLERGDLIGILGKDNSGNWVYVITLEKRLGWLPVASLRITGSLAGSPVLPPNPLQALAQEFAAPVSAASDDSGVATGTNSGQARNTSRSVALTNLAPVTTARVNSALLNVRQRPGPDYKLLNTLSQDDQVTILALNQDKFWALIKTIEDNYGWVSTDFLDVEGSLANAPQVRTLQPTSPDEAPPIVVLSGSVTVGPAIEQEAGSDIPARSEAAPAVIVESAVPIPGGNTLAVVASALVNAKIESRRGPANSYGAVDELTVDEKVDVLARNEQGDWVVVRTPIGSVGWFPRDKLYQIDGVIDNAAPILTAWVESNETAIRNGPGIYYDSSGNLAINDLVSVLALNQGRNWALVEAINGGRGWLPLRLIEVTSSLATIPEIALTELAAADSSSAQSLPVPGATSVTSGKLVFQTASGGDIMVINADGSDLRRLTNGIDPVLSPDGQQVAFTRWVGDIGSLWTIDIDGTNERQNLGEMRKAKGPEWSPDGSQIVLNFQQGGRLEENQVCRALDQSPSPPRNSRRIRVVVNDKGEAKLCWILPPDPNWTLRVINLVNGKFEDLYGGLYAFRPTWDPNQPWRVVSDSGDGLLAVDVNRDDYREPLTDVVGDGSPIFSPDGRFIAVTTRLQNEYAIFRMNSDGGGRVRLTETPLWVPVQADSDGKLWNNIAPTWSPDGSQIAFLTDRNGVWEIWIMNVDGSNQRPMFSDEINSQIDIRYDFVDERVLSWR